MYRSGAAAEDDVHGLEKPFNPLIMRFWNKLLRKPSTSLDYNRFWKWFRKHQQTFYQIVKSGNNIDEAFFDPLSVKLDELKEGFFFLCGMADENITELIFSAEGNLKNIVFIEELVAAAPSIEGWLFTALKPVTPLKDINIEMSGFSFNSSNIHFFPTVHQNFPDEIDITLVHDDLTESNASTIINGTYIFLDMCIGELQANTIIDSLDVVGRREAATQDLIPIEKLESYLVWREKEFVDKYEATYWVSEENRDTYVIFEDAWVVSICIGRNMNCTLISFDQDTTHVSSINL